jgi:hypothetical protein
MLLGVCKFGENGARPFLKYDQIRQLNHHQRVHVHLSIFHPCEDRIGEFVAPGADNFTDVVLFVVEISPEF